jgi:hypothetical protein
MASLFALWVRVSAGHSSTTECTGQGAETKRNPHFGEKAPDETNHAGLKVNV